MPVMKILKSQPMSALRLPPPCLPDLASLSPSSSVSIQLNLLETSLYLLFVLAGFMRQRMNAAKPVRDAVNHS